MGETVTKFVRQGRLAGMTLNMVLAMIEETVCVRKIVHLSS